MIRCWYREADDGPGYDVERVKNVEDIFVVLDLGVRSELLTKAFLPFIQDNMRIFYCRVKICRERKRVTRLDDSDRSVSQTYIFAFYEREESPCAKKLVVEMNEAVGFGASVGSMLRISKCMGFQYAR
jgi:hypothetical protein